MATLLVFPATVSRERAQEILDALAEGRLPADLTRLDAPNFIGVHEFDPQTENVFLMHQPAPDIPEGARKMFG